MKAGSYDLDLGDYVLLRIQKLPVISSIENVTTLKNKQKMESKNQDGSYDYFEDFGCGEIAL